jgi:large subunit ribosomal protein L33
MAANKSKKKKTTVNVRLVSTAKKADGSATGYFYIRIKNPKKQTEKMQFRLYDPVVRQHVLFTEKKETHQSS